MIHDRSVLLKKSKALPFVEIRKAINSSACYHAHSHDEFSFGVIDTGTANYINLKHKNIIKAGDTVTINPGDTHACNPSSINWSYRMLFVDTNWIGEMQSEISDFSHDYQPFERELETDKKVFKSFNVLFNALDNEAELLNAETLLIQFLGQCFYQKDNANKKENNEKLQRIKALLLDELNENHSLSELAEESGLSRYHLIRSFKKEFGFSPHALQLDERIKRAKIMLKSGHSIIEISSQLGFSDQSHFQRNFKKRLALTPKQYQAFFS